jgi:hypothetical protein
MFVVCQDVQCDMSQAVYVNYGGARFGLSRARVSDVFIDNQGAVIASIRTIYMPTNDTINAIVRMGKSDQTEPETLEIIEPTLL